MSPPVKKKKKKVNTIKVYYTKNRIAGYFKYVNVFVECYSYIKSNLFPKKSCHILTWEQLFIFISISCYKAD